MSAIVTRDLTKKFGELAAVDGASIKINKGELFGLLGPNGAGKGSLIHMNQFFLWLDFSVLFVFSIAMLSLGGYLFKRVEA